MTAGVEIPLPADDGIAARYCGPVEPKPVVRPISESDIAAVSIFLHEALNPRVSVDAWARLLSPPWPSPADNRGFQLIDGGRIVGAYAAVYSTRVRDGESIAVCNLAAFCVREEYRNLSLLLLRAMLRQKGFVFTDLSPSGNVVAMNERLGFRRLDTTTRIVVNLPRFTGKKWRVSSDPSVIESTLTGTDPQIYADHRQTSATEHLVVRDGSRYAYLVFRADRRKGLRLFASPLYVGGDEALLAEAWGAVRAHVLRTRRLPFFLAETRVLGFSKGLGRAQRHPRSKMYRAAEFDESSIDYLYSELTLVNW